jgi:hypothetical protein
MWSGRLLFDFVSEAYNFALLLAVFCAVYRFKQVDTGTRYLCLFIWLGAVAETVGWVVALKYRNNMPVYAISSLVTYTVICMYFNSILPGFKRYALGIWIALAGLCLGVWIILKYQPLHVINSSFLFYECLVIVCMALYSMYKRLMATDLRLSLETHYWGASILLFYKCTALWNWGFYDFFTERHVDKVMYLNTGILLVNLLAYFSLSILLFFYPKMHRTYV